LSFEELAKKCAGSVQGFYGPDHLRRLVKLGRFPAPIYLSPRRPVWIETAVDDYLAALARRDPRPPRLEGDRDRRGRFEQCGTANNGSSQLLNRSKNVTAVIKTAPDPIAEIAAVAERIKPALATMSSQDRDRLRVIIDELARELRYASVPADTAAKRKAGAERKRRHDERLRKASQQAAAE
jgi:predicted DNA-binding transcriptional regulator AlpA